MEAPRSLVESKEFAEQKDAILPTIEGVLAFDSMMAGVDIVLCRKPDQYGVVEGTNGVRLFETRPFDNLPPFKIWYRFDDETVTLLYIEESAHE